MSEKKGCMRWREIGCAFVLLIILCVVLLPRFLMPAIESMREVAGRLGCQNNLKMFGLVFKMYAMEHGGSYPSMLIEGARRFDCSSSPPVATGKRGIIVAAPDIASIYPEYFSDPGIFVCRSIPDETARQVGIHAQRIADLMTTACDQEHVGMQLAGLAYNYNGYAIYAGDSSRQQGDLARATSEARQLSAALAPAIAAAASGDWTQAKQLIQEDVAVSSDIDTSGETAHKVYRLREGVERFFITDTNNEAEAARVQSEIWIMHDRVHSDIGDYWHTPGGSYVVYLDGHVEYRSYSGQPSDLAPVNRAIAEVFTEQQLSSYSSEGGDTVQDNAPTSEASEPYVANTLAEKAYTMCIAQLGADDGEREVSYPMFDAKFVEEVEPNVFIVTAYFNLTRAGGHVDKVPYTATLRRIEDDRWFKHSSSYTISTFHAPETALDDSGRETAEDDIQQADTDTEMPSDEDSPAQDGVGITEKDPIQEMKEALPPDRQAEFQSAVKFLMGAKMNDMGGFSAINKLYAKDPAALYQSLIADIEKLSAEEIINEAARLGHKGIE